MLGNVPFQLSHVRKMKRENREVEEKIIEKDGAGEKRTGKERSDECELFLQDIRTQLPRHSANDSERAFNNDDKSIAHEVPPGKLSSGRVICGSLAVSLRGRNPAKTSSLAGTQIKESPKLGNNDEN
ncbi:uncharacterized protein LOC124295086 [Neodiprion lecontei]|uniref:Uncharacterized protein LOC124295086 n=1 Tax=Neodiprion lecontei TaxID=441921 RepID=A0ABM3GGI0_NEOLC|nr:uncharacterized protein LOC124295086 [Neodiprion lecontei]